MTTPSHDDETLLQRYRRSGDQQAFTTLVERHLPMVFGSAQRDLHQEQDAKDVCQEVFTKLAIHSRKGTIRHLASWLYTCTQREVLMIKRSEGRRRVRETRAAEMEALEQATQLASPPGSPQTEKVRELYGNLSEKDQQALFLRFHEELDFSKVGEAMGTNQRTAQKRVYRAIENLRQRLAKQGITSTAALIAGGLAASNAATVSATLHHSIAKAALFRAAATPVPTLLSVWFTSATAWISAAVVITTATVFTATLLTSANPVFLDAEQPEANRSKDRLAERTPKARSTNRISIDDIEAIYRLPNDAKHIALHRLSVYLESQYDLSYLLDLFQRWTALDHPRCLDTIMSLFDRTKDAERFAVLSECLAAPIQHWHSNDSSGLRTWLSQVQRTLNGEPFAFETVIATIGQDDLSTAFHLLTKRGATAESVYDRLARIVAKDGIEAAWSALSDLPSLPKTTAQSTSSRSAVVYDAGLDPKARLVTATVPHLFEHAPQAIADWIVELPDTEEGNAFTQAFIALWAESDPLAAAAWTETELSMSSRNVVAPALAESWAAIEPHAALDWIVEEALTEQPYAAARLAFARWTQESPSEAITWLQQHTDTPEAGPLFGLAADSLEADHAVTWARELPHTTNRRQALQHAFYIHARSDPATAREHLREVEPNQAHAAATRAWAHGVYTSSGRRALTQWRIKEEDAGNRQLASMIQASEVNILAAINPNLVSNTILDLPPGDHKDALLHELIDRTYQRSREHALTAKQWLSELEDYSRNKTWTATIDQVLLGESWDMPLELPVQRTASLNAQTFGEFSESLDILARMPHDL